MTSLQLIKNLSEASFKIIGACKLKKIDLYITYDEKALRTWQNYGHIKTYHLKPRNNMSKFVSMFAFDECNYFILLFSFVDVPGGVIEVWSDELVPVQQIMLQYNGLKAAYYDSSKSSILLLDSESYVTCLSFSLASTSKSTKFNLNYYIDVMEQWSVPLNSNYDNISLCSDQKIFIWNRNAVVLLEYDSPSSPPQLVADCVNTNECIVNVFSFGDLVFLGVSPNKVIIYKRALSGFDLVTIYEISEDFVLSAFEQCEWSSMFGSTYSLEALVVSKSISIFHLGIIIDSDHVTIHNIGNSDQNIFKSTSFLKDNRRLISNKIICTEHFDGALPINRHVVVPSNNQLFFFSLVKRTVSKGSLKEQIIDVIECPSYGGKNIIRYITLHANDSILKESSGNLLRFWDRNLSRLDNPLTHSVETSLSLRKNECIDQGTITSIFLDSNRLYCGYSCGCCKSLNLLTFSSELYISNSKSSVTCINIFKSMNEMALVVGKIDGEVSIFHCKSKRLLASKACHSNALRFVKVENEVIVLTTLTDISLWTFNVLDNNLLLMGSTSTLDAFGITSVFTFKCGPKYSDIICFCGFSNGYLRSWDFGEKSLHITFEACRSNVPVVFIQRSCVSFEPNEVVLCGFMDGYVGEFISSNRGYFSPVRYFNMPICIIRIFYTEEHSRSRFFCGFSTSGIIEFPPDISFEELIASEENNNASLDVAEEYNNLDYVYETPNDYFEKENVRNDNALDDSNVTIQNDDILMKEQNLTSEKPSDFFSPDLKFLMEESLSIELFKIKKDVLLLNLFVQNKDGEGISRDVAVSVLTKWINTPLISADNVNGLFRLLRVQEYSDYESFSQVAAILKAFISSVEKHSPKLRKYPTMRMQVSKDHYDEFGEKTYRTVPVVDGIPKGFVTKETKKYSETKPRTSTINRFMIKAPSLLHKIPSEFLGLIRLNYQIPKIWSLESGYWISVDSVIDFCREIFDKLNLKIEAVMIAREEKLGFDIKSASIAKCIHESLELQYGSPDLPPFQDRLVSLLEGCLQYHEIPIVGIMKKMIFSSFSTSWSTTCIWAVISLRNNMFKSKSVRTTDYEDSTFRQYLAPKSVFIARVCDLLTEGGFGESHIRSVLDEFVSLPVVDRSNDLMDLELGLEYFGSLFSKSEKHVLEIEELASSKTDGGIVENQISLLRHLMIRFVIIDTKRVGILPLDIFKHILKTISETYFDPLDNERSFELLEKECLHRFGNFEGVCYVDIWCIWISWIRMAENPVLCCTSLYHALCSTKIGLTDELAKSLLLYVQSCHFPNDQAPFWTRKRQKDLHVDTTGNWRLPSTSIIPSTSNEGLHINGSSNGFAKEREDPLDKQLKDVASKFQITQVSGNSPMIAGTFRELKSLHGEVCTRHASIKKKAAISVCLLDDDNLAPLENQTLSFSRSLNNLVIPKSQEVAAVANKSSNQFSKTLNSSKNFRDSSASLPIKNSLIESSILKADSDMIDNQMDLQNESIQMTSQMYRLQQFRRKVSIEGKKLPRLDRKSSSRRFRPPSFSRTLTTGSSALDLQSKDTATVTDSALSLEPSISSIPIETGPPALPPRPITPEQSMDDIVLLALKPLATKPSPSPSLPSSTKPALVLNENLVMERENQQMNLEDSLGIKYPIEDSGAADDDMDGSAEYPLDDNIADELDNENEEMNEIDPNENVDKDDNEENVEGGEEEEGEGGEGEGEGDDGEDEGDGDEEGEEDVGDELTGDQESPNDVIFDADEKPRKIERVMTEYERKVANKVNDFLEAMANIVYKNKWHPRRSKEKNFFFPQMFADDINYLPCGSSCTDYLLEDYEVPTKAADEYLDIDMFGEINRQVVDYRRHMKEQRLMELYSTSNADASAAEWSSLYLKDSVDWKQYFLDEKRKKLAESILPPLEAKNEKLVTKNRSIDKLQLQLCPLIIGSIKELSLSPAKIQYFQVESLSYDSSLTLEVTCNSGNIHCICSTNQVPDNLHPFEDLFCHAGESKRLFLPMKAKDFMVVKMTSMEESSGTIWIEYTQAPKEASPLEQTSLIIAKLNTLASYTDHELHQRYSELEKSASESVLAAAKQKKVRNQHFEPQSSTNLSEELIALDDFIMKSGRKVMKQNMKSLRGDSVSSNSHEDMFPDRSLKLPAIKKAAS